MPAQTSRSPDKQSITNVVKAFEEGLQHRDLKQIEKTVSPEIVVFENGHRNHGWQDFRDNHLLPEMKEPAPAMKTELKKVRLRRTSHGLIPILNFL